MAHPFMWPNKVFFYPIGNTPPVCLTQTLPPEEDANVLLLGCGDPRHILYTLHASIKLPNKLRRLDFTCCDIDPAILARNVLLFTLIVDRIPSRLIWNIFYHFKLDEASLASMVAQCEKLISVSSDLEAWSNSKYSAFLRFCTHRTLAQLRQHWMLYMKAAKFSEAKNKEIIAMFSHEYKSYHETGSSLMVSASRSAGPFLFDAVKIQSTHVEHYWKSGTVFTAAEDVASAMLVNPTFIYSLKGEGCSVHYGSYPLQSFHLLAAFASENAASKPVTIDGLFSSAQSQFQKWCDALIAASELESRMPVTIRLFAGDALAFCYTLRHCHVTSSTSAARFVSAFTTAELVLDGGDYGANAAQPAPTAFDVIETSNVTDHVGLLNVLITTVPLLIQSSSTTLYTESLLINSPGDTLNSFNELLCADIQTISLLFGVAPVGYLSGFDSHCNVHEILMSSMQNTRKQYHERVAWKIPHLGDALGQRQFSRDPLCPTFKPLELAKLLSNIYYNMFPHEDLMNTLQNPKNTLNSILHYSRATFTALLGFVKARIRTDWVLVMKAILDMMEAPGKLILGSNFYQEFCSQLFLQGVHVLELYKQPSQSLRAMYFRDWKRVPPMVCLLLIIPKVKVAVLDRPGIGTPILQCDVRSSTFHNIFSDMQLVYGSVSVKGTGSDARAVVTEDPRGSSGSSDLVLSVWVPAFGFTVSNPQQIQIGLGIQGTPAMSIAFHDTLGLMMTVFSAKLLDRKHVHVLAESPYFSRQIRIPEVASPTSTHEDVIVDAPDMTISTLTAKWDFSDDALVNANGEVQSQQASPCAMNVTVGKVTKLLVYPFPINGKDPKLAIARKSRWVQVTVPLSFHRRPGGFSIKNFPLLPHAEGGFTAWNVHRVYLQRLPTFDPQKQEADWVNAHIALGMSDRERERRESKVSPSVDVLVHVKDTIHSLFGRATEPNAHRVFALTDPSGGGTYTFIFINRLCFDLASATLVADTCILPLTYPFLKRHGQQLANLTVDGKSMLIVTEGAEVTAWKHLLPAFVERCRTWSHKPSCKYLKTGEIPLGVELEENPICACGEGVELGAMTEVASWKFLAPYMTRAAISQLFAVSYLESVAGALKDIIARGSTTQDSPNAGATSCARCGKSASEAGKQALMKCSRCLKTMYCGRECQTAHWKQHKAICKKERQGIV